MRQLEKILEWGGVKRDISFLVISGIALVLSIFHIGVFGFDFAWIAIVLCGRLEYAEGEFHILTLLNIIGLSLLKGNHKTASSLIFIEDFYIKNVN